jgi:hypothetical protein
MDLTRFRPLSLILANVVSLVDGRQMLCRDMTHTLEMHEVTPKSTCTTRILVSVPALLSCPPHSIPPPLRDINPKPDHH